MVVSLDKARGTEVMKDRSRGLLRKSSDNFSCPESYFMSARITLEIEILLFFKLNSKIEGPGGKRA